MDGRKMNKIISLNKLRLNHFLFIGKIGLDPFRCFIFSNLGNNRNNTITRLYEKTF